MPTFDNPILRTFTIPSGATSGARIVIDGVNGVILVYDSFNQLVESITPGTGTDPSGQTWVAGFASYLSGQRNNYVQMFNGQVTLSTPLNTVAGTVVVNDNQGPNNDQPDLVISSPAYSGFPQPNLSFMQLFGANGANSEPPYVRIGSRGAPPQDIDVQVAGQIKYSAPGSLTSEIWHPILPQTNWSALGAPWSDPQYQRTGVGTVRFCGAIQWTDGVTAAPVTIFTLPTGYRPNKQKRIPVVTMPGDAVTPQVEALTITTGGVVMLTNYPAGGPNTPITLDGVEFDLVV